MVRLTDRLDMTIAVNWDVKPQTKQRTSVVAASKKRVNVMLFYTHLEKTGSIMPPSFCLSVGIIHTEYSTLSSDLTLQTLNFFHARTLQCFLSSADNI